MAAVLVDGADDSWFYCSIGCLNRLMSVVTLPSLFFVSGS